MSSCGCERNEPYQKPGKCVHNQFGRRLKNTVFQQSDRPAGMRGDNKGEGSAMQQQLPKPESMPSGHFRNAGLHRSDEYPAESMPTEQLH